MKIHALTCFAIGLAVSCQVMAAEKPKSTVATDKRPAAATPIVTTNDTVVARVNGSEISRRELDAAVHALTLQMARRGRQALPGMTEQLESNVLEELIGRELLFQEGSKHPKADVAQKTKAQIDLVKKQLGGDEQYKSTLAETGITPEMYEKRVHDNVIIQETIADIVDKQAKVTPEEVKRVLRQEPGPIQTIRNRARQPYSHSCSYRRE